MVWTVLLLLLLLRKWTAILQFLINSLIIHFHGALACFVLGCHCPLNSLLSLVFWALYLYFTLLYFLLLFPAFLSCHWKVIWLIYEFWLWSFFSFECFAIVLPVRFFMHNILQIWFQFIVNLMVLYKLV
jgi:hypothetical protein